MAEGAVRSTVVGGVAEITLSRPKQRNPLDYAAVQQLVVALRQAEAAAEVRVILLRGEGDGFCAGGDLREFADLESGSAYQHHESGAGWAELMTLPRRLSVPVIVAAHGYAFAGGCGLVAAADVAVAAAGTRFSCSEVRIGLFPIIVLPALANAVGQRRARELALTGRTIDADEALRIGLVQQLFPADGFVEAARTVATEMAAMGRHACRLGKYYLRHVEDMPQDDAVAFGQSMRGAFLSSPDFAEGVRAFLDKRRPSFE